MVLKGVNVHTDKQSNLKGIHLDKIRSYGLERSQLGTQCKNQVIWS